jgi:hypothetical protein
MAFCRMVDFIYAALPLRPLRDFLIRTHMEGCPRCQARLLSREEARTLFVNSDAVGSTEALWRRISVLAETGKAFPERQPAVAGVMWRWAAAGATAAVVALAGFWLLREINRPGFDMESIRAADRFQIDYINVGGAPAQTFVFQPQGSDTVFVWAIKNP